VNGLARAENKIARICWNTAGWRKPSGRAGKSRNKKAYEYLAGFGHEEWLLDTSKLINGWHYSYLQPIGSHHSRYIGKSFNIFLYSINKDTRRRWWIGQIRDAEVTTAEQSEQIYRVYEKNGWMREMEEQLRSVNAAVSEFRKPKPEQFVVIRFRPKSLDLLDTPMEFSRDDPAVSSTYYVLLNKKQAPKLLANKKQFTFVPGHREKKHGANINYEKQSANVDLIQNRMQTAIFRQLAKEYGNSNVGTENKTVNGSEIDVVVRLKHGEFLFYEIKTSFSVRLNIREALGQLLEYAYYPPAINVMKLIIVSDKAITPQIEIYLDTLRKRFDLPIHYQRYDPENEALEMILH